MTTRAKVHRASAQRRRQALLDAAADLSAEVGAGSVTHRAIAARAGVPLSTTSYFFDSIGDLLTEALAGAAKRRVDDYDAAERIGVLEERGSIHEVVRAVAEHEAEVPRTSQAAQAEYLLAAGRQPELRAGIQAAMDRLAQRTAGHLAKHGAPQADAAARALLTLNDGALLARLAALDVDHVAALESGVRLLLAAAQLSDDEIEERLARYDADPA